MRPWRCAAAMSWSTSSKVRPGGFSIRSASLISGGERQSSSTTGVGSPPETPRLPAPLRVAGLTVRLFTFHGSGAGVDHLEVRALQAGEALEPLEPAVGRDRHQPVSAV